jgi:hypothetical protein
VLGALAIPAMARADGLRLRGDVTARGDVLTLADLIAAGGHVPAQAKAVGPGHGGDRERAEHRDG